MARLPRICLPGFPQHVIQRGNNRQACFASEEDYAAYAHWLEEFSRKNRVQVHAWVFMTNHVHLLVTPETKDGISLKSFYSDPKQTQTDPKQTAMHLKNY